MYTLCVIYTTCIIVFLLILVCWFYMSLNTYFKYFCQVFICSPNNIRCDFWKECDMDSTKDYKNLSPVTVQMGFSGLFGRDCLRSSEALLSHPRAGNFHHYRLLVLVEIFWHWWKRQKTQSDMQETLFVSIEDFYFTCDHRKLIFTSENITFLLH